MKKLSCTILILTVFIFFISCQNEKPKDEVLSASKNNYEELVALFKEWRTFETPLILDGAPDYTSETFEKRWPEFKKIQAELIAIDTANWTIEHKVDWYIVWAEMNGYDFNYRILKPWVRDPAFYKSLWTERSDVPAHEGPTHHKTTES